MSSQDQLKHLNSQLVQLQANLAEFNELVKDTTAQYKQIQSLGINHASIFMASHAVFDLENFAKKDDIP